MSVPERFATLLDKIAVTQREVEAYDVHQSGVKQALVAQFPGSSFVAIGSHVRGSCIGGTSDLDLLMRVPIGFVRRSVSSNELMSSATVLNTVRQRLLSRYPTTVIGRDGQAVVVSFAGGARDIDVVPAAWVGMVDIPVLNAKRPAYYIPDGAGGWLATAPQAHNDYINRADVRSGKKLKYVAQLLRHWRRSRTPAIPMLSFHAELVLAQAEACNGMRGYASVLAGAFSTLAARQSRALLDPVGLSGHIPIATTDPKRERVATALLHAAHHAAKACAAESDGRLQDAYDQWSIVFNGNFPKR